MKAKEQRCALPLLELAEELRLRLGSSDKPDIAALVTRLVSDLKLLPQNLTTKQVAMMVLGWSERISEIQRERHKAW